MTTEEAKHIVNVAFGVPQAVRRFGEDRTYHEDEIREAKKMAIQALEQEPILEKIRAEIEEAVWEDVVVSLDGTDETRIPTLDPDDVFKIIDKYKTESEDTE